MYFYQILTTVFPEFCFINLFFIGLLYTAFCHQKEHSELDLFLKKNS